MTSSQLRDLYLSLPFKDKPVIYSEFISLISGSSSVHTSSPTIITVEDMTTAMGEEEKEKDEEKEKEKYETASSPGSEDATTDSLEEVDVTDHLSEYFAAHPIDCIFSHQEYLGCDMGGTQSVHGDTWPSHFPFIISGHIHDYQMLGNILYPGSPIQNGYGKSHRKTVSLIRFSRGEVSVEDPQLIYSAPPPTTSFLPPLYITQERIHLGIQTARTIHLKSDQLVPWCQVWLTKYQEYDPLGLPTRIYVPPSDSNPETINQEWDALVKSKVKVKVLTSRAEREAFTKLQLIKDVKETGVVFDIKVDASLEYASLITSDSAVSLHPFASLEERRRETQSILHFLEVLSSFVSDRHDPIMEKWCRELFGDWSKENKHRDTEITGSIQGSISASASYVMGLLTGGNE
jgi:hypothetical protein